MPKEQPSPVPPTTSSMLNITKTIVWVSLQILSTCSWPTLKGLDPDISSRQKNPGINGLDYYLFFGSQSLLFYSYHSAELSKVPRVLWDEVIAWMLAPHDGVIGEWPEGVSLGHWVRWGRALADQLGCVSVRARVMLSHGEVPKCQGRGHGNAKQLQAPLCKCEATIVKEGSMTGKDKR